MANQSTSKPGLLNRCFAVAATAMKSVLIASFASAVWIGLLIGAIFLAVSTSGLGLYLAAALLKVALPVTAGLATLQLLSLPDAQQDLSDAWQNGTDSFAIVKWIKGLFSPRGSRESRAGNELNTENSQTTPLLSSSSGTILSKMPESSKQEAAPATSSPSDTSTPTGDLSSKQEAKQPDSAEPASTRRPSR